jgi:hypothetical protein
MKVVIIIGWKDKASDCSILVQSSKGSGTGLAVLVKGKIEGDALSR